MIHLATVREGGAREAPCSSKWRHARGVERHVYLVVRSGIRRRLVGPSRGDDRHSCVDVASLVDEWTVDITAAGVIHDAGDDSADDDSSRRRRPSPQWGRPRSRALINSRERPIPRSSRPSTAHPRAVGVDDAGRVHDGDPSHSRGRESAGWTRGVRDDERAARDRRRWTTGRGHGAAIGLLALSGRERADH